MQWLRKQIREGMNTRTYALVGVLLAMLLWIHSLDEKTRAIRARAASGGAAPAPAVLATSSDRASTVTPTPPGWGRDPFDRRFRLGRESAPAAAVRTGGDAPRGAGLFLQGVMNGPRGRTALVNGEVVREGDRIAGREVLQIGARSILVLDHGTVVTVTLKGEGS